MKNIKMANIIILKQLIIKKIRNNCKYDYKYSIAIFFLSYKLVLTKFAKLKMF